MPVTEEPRSRNCNLRDLIIGQRYEVAATKEINLAMASSPDVELKLAQGEIIEVIGKSPHESMRLRLSSGTEIHLPIHRMDVFLDVIEV